MSPESDMSIGAPKGPIAFLVGAGISLNPPTGFPTARGLIDKILAAISPDEDTLRQLHLLADSDRRDKESPGNYIRFELLLDSINGVLDPSLKLLDFIEIFQEPNPLHFLLAKRAIEGDLVITTNFDSLIEQAILAQGHFPISIARLEKFSYIQKILESGKIPVFKLHGTYLEFNGSNRQLAKSTIQATLGAVVAGVSGLVLPEPKRTFLAQVFRSRQVVVAGYSGSDDLDIMPTLLELQPPSIVWIEHDSRLDVLDATNSLQLNAPTEITNLTSVKEKFFKAQLTRDRKSLRLLRANTSTFLTQHFGDNCVSPIDNASSDPRAEMDSFLKRWEREFVDSLSLKHTITADLLYRLSLFDSYYEHTKKAWDSSLTTDSHRSLLATMMSKALGRLGYRSEASSWARKGLDLLSATSSEHDQLRCFHQIGYALYKEGKIEESLEWLGKCAELAKNTKANYWLSVAIHDTAMIYQDRGEYSRAVTQYRKSVELSSRAGDIGHVAWSLHQIGACYFDQGLFANAQEAYLESARISGTIGDLNHLSFTEHELGLLDFTSGRILSAARHFHHCIQIDRRTGQNEFGAVDWQHLGVVFMEAGKLQSAEKFFDRARHNLDAVGDQETLIELFAYRGQMELERNRPAVAAQWARDALAIKMDVPAYISRAELVLGIAKFMEGDQAGVEEIEQAIDRAKQHNIRAVLLDQVYLCCKFGVDSNIVGFLDLLNWAADLYRELGNMPRLNVLSKYQQNFSKLAHLAGERERGG